MKTLVHAAIILTAALAWQTAFAETAYEAETGTLANGARAGDCAACSGGKQVRNLGGDANGTVTFEHVRVPRAGLYPLTIYYNVGDDRSFTISVNTNARCELIFKRAAGRNEASHRTVLVPLRGGDNTIAFNNAGEFAPDLDRVTIGDEPVAAMAIAGTITGPRGRGLAGVEVSLAGELAMRTTTDAAGRYEFPFVPRGEGYVRAFQAGTFFSPYEQYVSGATNAIACDFLFTDPPRKKISTLKQGKWRIEYDLARGVADLVFDGKTIIAGAFAAARLPETVTSRDYPDRALSQRKIQDAFGRGVEYAIESSRGAADKMVQTFRLYEKADYLIADVKILRQPAASSRYLAPLVSDSSSAFLPPGDNRALFVPFDNDKWIRYDALPFGGDALSYEVSAFYHSASRRALVIGSIEHDTWKTGVRSATTADGFARLEVFGGVTSTKTRDVLPHGKISGAVLKSPAIFVGGFADWRDGLEAYARANATIAPARAWDRGAPFGWNSWGKIQFRLTFDKAIQVSDFFARELQPRHFENDGVVYIGLDSGWNRFSDEQLKQFVDHCHSNHQEAGIYLTPFSSWRGADDAAVEGTDYRYQDLFLRARGEKQFLDGGAALDPTHPGTKKIIERTIARFHEAGFAYVKADFLTHGALEADGYYDPRVTTGLQAYNEGMRFVAQALGDKMFLNLSISPLFPAHYANSRRIACDTFGDIAKTEYQLNSLTYGWWLDRVYDFNDADHVVLDNYREGENRARATSSVITGIFITGDDFSDEGEASVKERARKFLGNEDVNALARRRGSFRPVEGDGANRAATLFAFADEKNFYLAALNYSGTNVVLRADFKRIGLNARGPVRVKELWRGTTREATSALTIELGPADAAIYRFDRR